MYRRVHAANLSLLDLHFQTYRAERCPLQVGKIHLLKEGPGQRRGNHQWQDPMGLLGVKPVDPQPAGETPRAFPLLQRGDARARIRQLTS